MDVEKAIRDFLSQYITDFDLQNDQDFFALGLVNSLFIMQLVVFVEQAFDINIDGDDLNFDSFRTINAISDLVRRKTQGP